MNGYGAPTMYGVPIATWNSWSASRQQLYLQDYNREDPWETGDCFSHGDGRTTCYNPDTGDYEILAYTYTYGVEEVTGDDVITHDTGVETGETVNAIIETLEDLPEDLQDLYEEGKDYATIAILIGVAVLLSK